MLIAVAGALGGFLSRFDTALINGAVEAIRPGFQSNTTRIGIAVSCALLAPRPWQPPRSGWRTS